MELNIRKAEKEDSDRCAEIRGLTRDNPISREVLISYGVTREAWDPLLDDGTYIGYVSEDRGEVVGYCYADTKTAEILVIALLPDYEGLGLGKKLLNILTERLFSLGHDELWLAAAPDPAMRAYGFYRHLGWVSAGKYDQNGDEILKLMKI